MLIKSGLASTCTKDYLSSLLFSESVQTAQSAKRALSTQKNLGLKPVEKIHIRRN